MRVAAACLALLAGPLAACGGSSQSAGGAEEPAASSEQQEAIELTLRTADGALLFVGDLRGRPVLLFLFATFDATSQAALRPLGRFVRAHPDAYVLGIAVQPDAEQLIDAYVHALSPPFPIAYETEERLESGETGLGPIDQIPTFVMLDALGRPVDRHVGFASERALSNMLYRAERAVPEAAAEAAREEPPLLGHPRNR